MVGTLVCHKLMLVAAVSCVACVHWDRSASSISESALKYSWPRGPMERVELLQLRQPESEPEPKPEHQMLRMARAGKGITPGDQPKP